MHAEKVFATENQSMTHSLYRTIPLLSGATEIAPPPSLPCGGRTRTTTFTLSVSGTTLWLSINYLPIKSWVNLQATSYFGYVVVSYERLFLQNYAAIRMCTPPEWSAAPPRLLLRGIVIPRDGTLCKGDLRSTVLYLGGRLLCGGAGIPGLPSCSICSTRQVICGVS